MPDKPRLVRAVRDTLKPGGRFAIINWQQRPRGETTILDEPRGPRTDLRLSPQQTIYAAKVDGIKVVVTIDVPPFHTVALLSYRT